MKTRLLCLAGIALFFGISQPAFGQTDKDVDVAELRLIDDRRSLPVPEDAHFSELMTRDLVMMMAPGGATDDPQGVYPEHRLILFAIPRSCSTLEAFYQEHWPGFEFLADPDSESMAYQAFLTWEGDSLHQLRIGSMDEVDDAAEGVFISASENPANREYPSGSDPRELMRELYGIPEGTDWCTVFMMNTRKVSISDIPLARRGLKAGDTYSSVTGLFQVIVPAADNFFVNQYSVAEASQQEEEQFVEEVSFLIGDFGELYRVGVVHHAETTAPTEAPIPAADAADKWARVPLTRHFQGSLPGEVELISAEMIATHYGDAVKAVYRVRDGSMLVQITGFDPIEASSPGSALVAVAAVPAGDYLVFATAQNDYLASENSEDEAIASIQSKATSLLNLLYWTGELPGETDMPEVMTPGMLKPHVEQCLNQFGTDDGVAFENTCDQPLAFQILMNPEQDDVLEYVIGSGKTLRIADEESRYAFAACPDGYQADRPFEGDDLQAIWASQYNCLKRESR